MNVKKRRRLAFAAALLIAAGGGTWLVINALGPNVLYFYSPSEMQKEHVQPGVDFRIGGLVARGSVVHGKGAAVRFKVTDGKATVPVDFDGVLPDLFREGQGIIAIGKLNTGGTFIASQVLAKHDARYMPPEVVAALKKAGRWKEHADPNGMIKSKAGL
ncbi:MAG: cytochrome c maturation protein CcmE [Alphaproteobacteria bacterium]|nr:cytochrome c maturation protein CcmE [Alphaproteobacteria bacterium]